MSGLILDTHAWYWITEDKENLSRAALHQIDQAQRQNKVFIAGITLWEIAMMSRKKRVTLPSDIGAWLNDALDVPGLSIITLTPRIAVESINLPSNFHADPSDQLIVATARVENLILVTRDRKILEYAAQGYVKVIPI